MSRDGADRRGNHRSQLVLDDLFCDVADEKFIQEVHTLHRLPGYETSSTIKGALSDDGLDEGGRTSVAERVAAKEGDGALPYSKARCIALVTTVVGASFTAVST